MAYAIYLTFDAATTQAIQTFSQALPLPGYVAKNGAPPHISLAAFTEAEPKVLPALHDLVHQCAHLEAPIEIDLQSLGAFASPDRVLFLSPVVTRALIELHERFHALLGPLGLHTNDYWLPGRWVPHCTLEQNLTPAQLGEAMTQAVQSFKPMQGRLEKIELVEFLPVKPLLTMPLMAHPTASAVAAPESPAPSVE